MKNLFLPFLLMLSFIATHAQDLLISEVNIVDVRSGEILPDRYVLVEKGKISRISASPIAGNTYEELNGDGKYLMPGLAEMHAHIPSPDWGREDTQATLFLYLANGITTIRGMLGHPTHLELKAAVRMEKLVSPRIFTSSPSLNGNTVTTEEEAREKVKSYKSAGYDFLKIHPGIKREVFDVLAETAGEESIPFAGHVPVDVGIRHALESGYASVDHVDGFIEGIVHQEAEVEPDENGFFGYNFTYLADTSRIRELVDMTREYGVWVVPTQSLFDRWFSPTSAKKYLREPEMKYMPASILSEWETSKKNLVDQDGYDRRQWEAFNFLRRMIIHELQENGHGLLLGSDAPQVFNVPGFSIHNEMQGMLEAGLSPIEIIRSGTVNPAKYFDQEGEFGEITTGASADLILINGNPLEDLRNIRNPSAVIFRGRLITKEEIDLRLQEIADESANE